MSEALVKKLRGLRPDAIVELDVLNDRDAIYEAIKLVLDNDCYWVATGPTSIFARKLHPIDDTGYPGLTFAIASYGDHATFDNAAGASPAITDPRNEAFVVWNQTSARAAFEHARLHGTKEWLVYTHHDVYIPKNWGPRFWSAVRAAETKFGPVGVAGVFGVSGDRRKQRVESGSIIDQDGRRTLVGHTPLPAAVRTLDGVVLGVRREAGLAPDPKLGFHFYDADVCLQAESLGLKVVVVDSWLLHRSVWKEPDAAFKASEQVFRSKWQQALPVEVPCALIA